VAREYEALRGGAALIDLSEFAVLEVKGPQRERFLQGMVTADVASLPPSGFRRGAMLEARGDVLALLRIIATPSAFLLETHGSCAQRVQRTLEHYRVAAPVRFALSSTVVLGLAGPRAMDPVRAATGLPEIDLGDQAVEATIESHPVRLVSAPDLGTGGLVLHTPEQAAPSVFSALVQTGATPAGRDAFDVHRIERGLPWWGREVTEEHLLHEAGLVAELCSFSKGCYVGQEIIARLEARGANVSRSLRGLRTARPLLAGAEVRSGAEVVGHVTSAGLSPRLGPVAMAYVHRKHFAPGSAVSVDDQEATVLALPLGESPHLFVL
jgi:folate-binding protein YgfZ